MCHLTLSHHWVSFSSSRLSSITFYSKFLSHTGGKERGDNKTSLYTNTYWHAQAKDISVKVHVDSSGCIEKEIFKHAQQYTNADIQILEQMSGFSKLDCQCQTVCLHYLWKSRFQQHVSAFSHCQLFGNTFVVENRTCTHLQALSYEIKLLTYTKNDLTASHLD